MPLIKHTTPANWKPKGFQHLTTGAIISAASLTVPNGANIALLRIADTGNIRYRDDGVDPTTTVGMVAGVTNEKQPLLLRGDLSAIRMISSSGSPNVEVLYYSTTDP